MDLKNILSYIILFLFVLSSESLQSQNEINFNPKSLFKEIQKFNSNKSVIINEIIIPDSIVEKYRIQGKYFLISDINNVSQIKYVYIGRVNSCRTGGCSISNEISADLSYEFFDYFILYDSKMTVKLTKVFSYKATHGQEITAKGWLKQFVGYNGSKELQVGKNIDAISGATISVYGITADIEIKTSILKQLGSKCFKDLI